MDAFEELLRNSEYQNEHSDRGTELFVILHFRIYPGRKVDWTNILKSTEEKYESFYTVMYEAIVDR